ncbi:MAG TPA: prepilin-type N-terminal cleavage/methylation domain-containing protein [Candidatus Saccharimonadales bacterium]|nr:prepilin-type N-terminal cleavage/methylation domain-containing protein [Candidatus Saccharimonadales bacterium]
MRTRDTSAGGQRGFTIVELLIATLVFSVVLLLVTVGILQVSRVYYKGVTETNTQNAARNILDAVSQAVQFNSGTVTPSPLSPPAGSQAFFCVGSQEFIYYPGYQLVDTVPIPAQHQTSHAVIEQAFSGGCAAPGSLTGRELLGPKMRISNLVLKNVGTNLWQVEVRVVFGDDAVINNPTTTTASCKPQQAGTQFCAISDLSTVVVKRVQ